MLKGISLPNTDFVSSNALAVLSASPVSLSPDGQLAVVDVLYTDGTEQLHAFLLVDLTNGNYVENFNRLIGLGDELAIKAHTAGVSWSGFDSPIVYVSYEDLTDASSSGIFNRIAKVDRTSLLETDAIEDAAGVVADGSILKLSIDPTGRYVAFETAATNLTPPGSLDTNTIADVYLLDTAIDSVRRVSVLQDGTEAADESKLQDLALIEGQVNVLFSTHASQTFSSHDTNGLSDLYLWNNGALSLLSADNEGVAGGYDNGLARFVGVEAAFLATDLSATDNDGLLDLYFVNPISMSKRIDPVVNELVFDSGYELWIEGNNNESVILGSDGAAYNGSDISNQLFSINTINNATRIHTLNASGESADDISDTPAISDSSKTVAFRTSATNLASLESLGFVVNHENDVPQDTLSLDGSARVGRVVTANLNSFNDIDGYGDGLTFRWFLDGILQSDSVDNAFTIDEAMLGRSLHLTIEYNDDWGVTEQVSLAEPVVIGSRNSAPVFSSDNRSIQIPESIEISETIFLASAVDLEDDLLTFSLSGLDSSLFDIDGASGAVTLNAPANYELKNAYSFSVIASDGELSDTVDVTLNVTDVNEAPVFGSSVASVAVPENADILTPVYTAFASDEDGDPVTYSLMGSDASALSVNPSSGELILNFPADYENKNQYLFTVQASDGFLTSAIDVTLDVTDVAEIAVVRTDSLSNKVTLPNHSLNFFQQGDLINTISSVNGILRAVPSLVSFDRVEVGSVNYDDGINISDAVSVLKHIVGLQTLANARALAADVNLDGVINISDAVAVLKHIVGLDSIESCSLIDSNQAEITSIELTTAAEYSLIQRGDVDLSATFEIL